MIETNRLYLRELQFTDAENLFKVLGDAESMIYYPAPFSKEKVLDWIQWNINNYRQYQHGLWAVIRKNDGMFLGDCGITMQEVEGELLPEVGYHIRKEFCRNGYATEAAKACIDLAFNQLNYRELITYTQFDNIPSIKVALKNGMKFVKYFNKTVMGKPIREALYKISKDE